MRKPLLEGQILSKTPLYHVWYAMKDRCYNKNHPKYKYYGGRNIKVCNSWLKGFLNFYNWAFANGYKKGLEIDRYPNNDGNYSPKNCRWATRQQQQLNNNANILHRDIFMERRANFKRGKAGNVIPCLYCLTPFTQTSAVDKFCCPVHRMHFNNTINPDRNKPKF